MTRLCIFVTYDCENIVDEYIGYLLSELRKVVDSLIVVCNYENITEGYEQIRPYADQIFYRKNLGFDAGAYKDAICHYIGYEKIYEYDELLLVNDSFYGPFYPFEKLFHRMGMTNADFWGLVRAPSGRLKNGHLYDSHIQSYFLLIRKKLLYSSEFKKFWEEMEYPDSFTQAIIKFELGFNEYFSKGGFKGTALTDLPPASLPEKIEAPHLLCALELICDMGIPILKRKSLHLGNRGFLNAWKALRYVGEKGCYDTNLIKKHLLRLGQSSKDDSWLNLTELNKFYHTHSRIYFYGAGVYGRNLASYFTYRGWSFQGFLVTAGEDQLRDCALFQDAEIRRDDGIIIAVSDHQMSLEIYEIVRTRCDMDQIFYLAVRHLALRDILEPEGNRS